MVYFEPIFSLLIHCSVVSLICLLLLFLVYFLTISQPNIEKNIAYECGFKPFIFAYYPFDVQFYRVGILFLLFDVEIIFFFPWLLNFYYITSIGHSSILLFLALLFIGFIYELRSGGLQWYPISW